jgi:transposase
MTTSSRSRVHKTTITSAKRVRPRRDFDALKERRLRAGEMFKRGSTQADVARVATVIETVTGVSYSTTQTWWILRERLGWSRQRPQRKALEATPRPSPSGRRNVGPW